MKKTMSPVALDLRIWASLAWALYPHAGQRMKLIDPERLSRLSALPGFTGAIAALEAADWGLAGSLLTEAVAHADERHGTSTNPDGVHLRLWAALSWTNYEEAARLLRLLDTEHQRALASLPGFTGATEAFNVRDWRLGASLLTEAAAHADELHAQAEGN